MPSTKQLRNGYSRAAVAALVALAPAATSAALASCSSGDSSDSNPSSPLDSAVEATTVDDAAIDQKARPTPPTHYDAGPAAITCTTHPCAMSLVTSTFVPYPGNAQPEGYCALLDDGTVACWGSGANGELGRGGDGGSTADSANPARVSGLSNVVKLNRTCAVDKSGGAWCWGTGPFLQDDAGTQAVALTPVKLPLPHAKNVAATDAIGCAELDDGVRCWGDNSLGSITLPATYTPLPPTLIEVEGTAPIRDLAVGPGLFVYREDGTVFSWGANPPLGRTSSLNPDPNPRAIALDAVASLDVVGDCACLTADGTGYCWGSIEVAANPNAAYPALLHALPTPVVAPEPLVQIATTQRSVVTTGVVDPHVVEEQRWCGVGASGAVFCWGYNSTGQAGDGTKNYAFSAVPVAGLPDKAVEVKTMPLSTCALLTSGQIYCWGNNLYGQLGNGTIKGVSLAPQRVVIQ